MTWTFLLVSSDDGVLATECTNVLFCFAAVSDLHKSLTCEWGLLRQAHFPNNLQQTREMPSVITSPKSF